ncbi:MAG: hypothetical protein HOF74_04345 [Gammaproteobacteria bacterium]|nr:hypothetical protein [Gammaproteobacteria bacterium]MBT3859038.1 hypothetical protein [Gammaproteobacteria bacterium]MBT3987851.1 hypothetical protein [Gammaproteobacteria bacterium]MBT4254440.1 hypothetical protein [Gammaproteobacteria bacterium]MBT4583289.1 hypothetical protein [Gammaproteobacteria bacterium]
MKKPNKNGILSLGRQVIYLVLAAMLAACSTEEPVSTSATNVEAAAAPGIAIRTLSTKPWLITGGDVLLELEVEAGLSPEQLSITLNESDVSHLFRAVGSSRIQAMLTDIPVGDSRVTATAANSSETASLTLTNYPVSGPIISGPHQQPFYCQTSEFETVAGDTLGSANDLNCSITTQINYVYWSDTDQQFKNFVRSIAGDFPEDMAMISQPSGESVPYLVRVETGTVNRAIYEIAMLHDPAMGALDPWNRSENWNGKLVYTHGGGCRGGWYQQGNRTGGVMRRGLFELGYAVTSSTLNVFGQNCNDLLASETHIMVKERFIEHYGVPVYSIATGASGGSYQSHQTADNYPGVFDGIVVSSSFPDVTSATIFTLADSRLLNYYFTQTNQEGFTVDQQLAVAGFGSWGSISNLSTGAGRLDPIYNIETPEEEQGGEVSIPALEDSLYSESNPNGVRATVYDHTVNVYGDVDGSNYPMAQRALDNVGVQYGLAALNDGVISAQQFIDLNRDIGGFDRNLNHVSERHRGDSQAGKRAIESGRVLSGGQGLASTPVIDYRSYTDHREGGDIHMIVHQFSTRQRLINANGHADNHVMQVGGLWGFTEEQPDLGNLFRQMDSWLMNIVGDTATADPVLKTVRNRPQSLLDSCWDNTDEQHSLIEERQAYSGNGACSELYPAYQTPRHVAGAPLENDIISCQRRRVSRADYQVEMTLEDLAQLEQVFPEGVCDWARGDASAAQHQGGWLSLGPSPVNRLF